MKTVKNRTLLVVSLVVLALSSFIPHEGIATHFNEEINNAIHEHEQLIDDMTSDIMQYSFDTNYPFKIRYFVEQSEPVRQAFADRERDLLYRLSLPQYQYLHGDNPYFHAMDFRRKQLMEIKVIARKNKNSDNAGEFSRDQKEVRQYTALAPGEIRPKIIS